MIHTVTWFSWWHSCVAMLKTDVCATGVHYFMFARNLKLWNRNFLGLIQYSICFPMNQSVPMIKHMHGLNAGFCSVAIRGGNTHTNKTNLDTASGPTHYQSWSWQDWNLLVLHMFQLYETVTGNRVEYFMIPETTLIFADVTTLKYADTVSLNICHTQIARLIFLNPLWAPNLQQLWNSLIPICTHPRLQLYNILYVSNSPTNPS